MRAQEARWDKDLTEPNCNDQQDRRQQSRQRRWAIDLSGGIIRVTLEHGVMAYGTARPAQWRGICPILCRFTVSRSTPRVPNSSPNIRRDQTDASSNGQSRLLDSEARDKGLAKQFPIILTSGVWWNTKAAARKRGRPLACRIAAGHVSSRSTRRTRANAASRMPAGSGCSVLKTARRRASRRSSPTEWVGRGVSRSISPAGSRVSISATNIRKQRSDRAWRKREHADVLWLRPGHRHARGQGDPVPDSIGVRGE